ncbi:MAG: glycosyltransferase [Candidatus Woesebacteria bacterium]
MKILQVVPYFYPAWSYGGPAKLVYDTCLYFEREGHQVTVFTSDAYDQESRMPRRLRIPKRDSLRIFYFRNIFNKLTYTYNIYCAPGLFLRTLWEIPQTDVIHLHDFYTPHNVWIALLAQIFSKPYILSVHGCLETQRIAQRSLFKKVFLRFGGKWLLHHASKVVATSQNEVSAYQEYGVKDDAIVLFGHGVNPVEFQSNLTKAAAKKSWKLRPDETIITFLGRIHKIKGLDLLVEAADLLHLDKLKFVIAGSDDGYATELRELIRQKGLININLIGTCYGKKKADLFKASDIFVYPSYSEGFSLGILEAGSTGLPLVLTTGCHFDEVGKTKSGLIVKPEPKALAKALQKMIDDPKLRKIAGANAKRLIQENYSMDSIGRLLLNTYRLTM